MNPVLKTKIEYVENPFPSSQENFLNKQIGRRLPFLGFSSRPHVFEVLEIDGEPVKIDKGMVPVVCWLNQFPGVTTQFCCHGEFCNEGITSKTYVIFRCTKLDSLERIFRILDEFAKEKSQLFAKVLDFFKVQSEMEYYDGSLRYELRWKDRISLEDFSDWLKEKNDDV